MGCSFGGRYGARYATVPVAVS
jgi:hypothetical protein